MTDSAFASGLSRRTLLQGATALGTAGAFSDGEAASAIPGERGFDFLLGRWRVRHRKLRARLAGADDWFEFDGILEVLPVLGGLGNIDRNVLDDPSGRYLATSLRLFDGRSGEWSIRWIDARFPGIDPPVTGRFEGRVGRFYGDGEHQGRPIRVRFTYQDISFDQARWDQAFSADGGRSWETNWIMNFTRTEALRP
jgi:hypothetical protein